MLVLDPNLRRDSGLVEDHRREGTDKIVGAHFVGHAGEELINLFDLAMNHGVTASEIRDFLFAYSTFSADIKSML